MSWSPAQLLALELEAIHEELMSSLTGRPQTLEQIADELADELEHGAGLLEAYQASELWEELRLELENRETGA